MSITSPTASAKKAIHKIDIAQVSLNLQDRLGLAKVRYERLHGLHGLHRDKDSLPSDSDSTVTSHHQSLHQYQHNVHPSEAGSDCSSSDSADARYSTPFTSSPVRTPRVSKELPRSSRSRHAATFDIKTMQCMTSSGGGTAGSSRKRRRCDVMAEHQLPKIPRISWSASGTAPQSSPLTRRQLQRRTYETMPSFISESDTIPDPDVERDVDADTGSHIDPQLSKSDHRGSSSSSASFRAPPPPPRTPPPRRTRFNTSQAGEDAAGSGSGADLLLYLANSPTPATINGKPAPHTASMGMPDFLPSTPPTQHAIPFQLLSTPTPSQPFNFADFVNVTPSPAQRAWTNGANSRTPLNNPSRTPRTPRTTKEVRKRLNFDTLAPPSPIRGSSSKRSGGSGSSGVGLALQLGEELPI
ncbi:uncharacterized protein GIQ15_00987 [Arthroderma uncinatum]|uniref:uncharacterized protein n=1 Tax=Arthroderma uncinatum TaxID=74035 RepID=UPI00144A7659|nr:uncharacterized protein GIQ15_00987 [Arthroderma uncinatum]KAF3491470.1 hypothetical protein GIQ15_00987 [Arthroderma uncinatum]